MRLMLLILFIIIHPHAGSAQHKKGWKKFLPDHAQAQFAGGIGFVAAGFGYSAAKDKIHLDAFYGYVPSKYAVEPLHSATAKLTWFPWNIELNKSLHYKVLTTGLWVNYTFGDQFYIKGPSQYPRGYYGYPTALHGGLFLGSAIQYKQIGLFVEAGAIDRELINYVRNPKSIGINHLVNFGAGLKYNFSH